MNIENTQYEIYLEKIQDDKIKSLIKATLESYGDENKALDVVCVSDWLEFVLINDKLVNENSYALFVDVLRAAALVHNLTYSYGKDKFQGLFDTREYLEFINIKENILVPETYLESICQTVEGQLGKEHPVVALIPNPNTPGYHFALACALYYKTGKTSIRVKPAL